MKTVLANDTGFLVRCFLLVGPSPQRPSLPSGNRPQDIRLQERIDRMIASLPFLTSYDPPGTSEGALDPLGLYQIADQLAVQLVPAVRERMQRVRFLTAMAVGALVTEGLEDDPRNRDASPYLVWEWLLVEAVTRKLRNDDGIWGVPGTLVAGRALDRHGYLDARSYLKTPRIFGFHGVYKRLATYLGVVDVHLAAGPKAEDLADAWARGLGYAGLSDAKPLIARWSRAVQRSLSESPPRTNPGWSGGSWDELALAFVPSECKAKEKRCLRGLLLTAGDRQLGALPTIWQIQADIADGDFSEERLHDRIEELVPGYQPLLDAIRSYEAFARCLQDGFDLLRAEAGRPDAQGFSVSDIAQDREFQQSVKGLHKRFEATYRALGELTGTTSSLQSLFSDRFRLFADPMDEVECALALCSHHEVIQKAKSALGKRPWFDRLGRDRIYIRHDYRISRPEIKPGRYVHDYRGWPIRRFWRDLV